jgi:putative transposase
MNDCFTFIRAEKAFFPIDWMCRKLNVSRASFYRWLSPAVPTKTQVRHRELDGHVVRVYDREKGKAGRDQITVLLAHEGVRISVGTVGSIMRGRDLRAVRMRAWKKTTAVDPQARTEHIRNHMLDDKGKRDFTSKVPGTRLCGDITYLRTGSGWLYLATVIDLSNRMVVGWSMASHMRTSLITGALTMARDHGHLDPEGAIFHSDRGSQYTSAEFQKWCAKNHVTQSMGAVGVCWDNAVAESFFSHLKTEMFHQKYFHNHLAARTAVMEYIESWYNRRRPHSHNQGLAPAAALTAYQDRRQPAAA